MCLRLESWGGSCCRTHGSAIANLQSATIVSLHGLTTISCHVGVYILYRDYNARERYGAPAGSDTSNLRLMPTI